MEKHIISISVIKKEQEIQHGRDIIILFNLGNELKITVDEQTFALRREDVILINSSQNGRIESSGDILCLSFSIDYSGFRRIFHEKKYYFLCNSTEDIDDNYALLRRLLSSLVQSHYHQNEYHVAEYMKLEMECLILLVNSFATIGYRNAEDERLDDILDYIDTHYMESLSLKEVSARFAISQSYFSRYFKEQKGIRFHDYVMQVRLEHALWELRETDKTLLKLALDNGFSNVDSFNHYFIRSLDIKPSEYRKQFMKQKESQGFLNEIPENILEAINVSDSRAPSDAERQVICSDAGNYEPLTAYWNDILNISDTAHFNDTYVYHQMEQLQQELSFHYLRMPLDIPDEYDVSGYSFFDEERTFSSLVRWNFDLWFAINLRHIKDEENMLSYLKAMLSYFANRFSIMRIKKWRFELCYDTAFNEPKCNKYFRLYNKILKILKSFDMDGALYGPCISIGNEIAISSFLGYMKKNRIMLPAVTFSSKPMAVTEGTQGISIRMATDRNFTKNRIENLKRMSKVHDFLLPEIFISEGEQLWAESNPLNDSCYGAAFLISNYIACYGKVSAMAYGCPLDMLTIPPSAPGILLGANGLISKHGIKKPVYFGYRFLNHLGRNLLTTCDDALITSSGTGNYQIIAHNCKRLNHRYYLTQGNFSFNEIRDFFDDRSSKELSFVIDNVKNGTYLVKKRSIDEQHGSIGDALYEMTDSLQSDIGEGEIAYLSQISVPRERLSRIRVSGHKLELTVSLAPNEIIHIHLIYQF